MAMFRRIFLGALAALGSISMGGIAFASDVAIRSEREFRELVIERLRIKFPRASFSVATDGSIELSGDDPGMPTEIHVQNFYRRYVNGEDSFDAAAEKLAASSLPLAPEIDRERIVVVVRPKGYADASIGSGAKLDTWERPIAGGLEYLLALDGERTISLLSRQAIRGVVEDNAQLWRLAVANTQRRIGDLEIKPFDESVWTLTSPNDLGLSVMALDAFWAKPPVKIVGRPAVAAIQKNLLVIVDTAAGPSFTRVRAWMTALKDDPDTMSTALLVRSDGVWKEI